MAQAEMKEKLELPYSQIDGYQQILQASEYMLPYHWLMTNNGNEHYRRKSYAIASFIQSYLSEGQGLDVGCGDGRSTLEVSWFLGNRFPIRGIDYDPRSIHFAQLLAYPLEFATYEGDRIPEPTDHLDFLILREVLEHIPDDKEMPFAMELNRVLRPGGIAIITVPSKLLSVSDKHFRHYDYDALAAVFEQAGFETLEVVSFGKHIKGIARFIYQTLDFFPGVWKLYRHRWVITDYRKGMTTVGVFRKKEA